MPDNRDPWIDVAAARLPMAGLEALAPWRCRPGVAVVRADDVAWATFPAGDWELIRGLIPVAGVEFFTRRGDGWARFGERLPTGDGPPAEGAVPLDRVIFPAPVGPTPPPDVMSSPVRLTIVRGGAPVPVTAVACRIGVLAAWAEHAPTAELTALRAARCGERTMLMGGRLPPIIGERFWGERLLIPAGYRAEPDLPPDVLRTACGVSVDELLLLTTAGAEVIPDSAFEPLTRAGVRLAL